MAETKMRISISDTDKGFTTIPLGPRVRSRRTKAPLISSSMKACKLNYQGSKGSVKILDIKVPLKRRVHFTDPPYYTRGHRDSDELPNFVINSGDIRCLQVTGDKETRNGRISLQGSLVSQRDERERQFFDKFTKDKKFRGKFLHTLCIYLAFWVLGWTIGQFGPSFLDLQVITDTTLEQGSAFMTSHSIGYLLGSLTLGLMFDRLDKILLVLFPLVGIGVTLAIIPWCAVYGLMIVIHLLKGLFNGGLDAVSNAETVYIWGDKGRSYMQALHFCFAMGGILSPLATAPFLVPIQQSNGIQINNEKIRDLLDHRIQSQDLSFFNNTSVQNLTIPLYEDEENVTKSFLYTKQINHMFSDYKQNTTLLPIFNSTVVKYMDTKKPVSTSGTSKPEVGSTSSKLYIAYTTTSALAFVAAIPFLVMYIKGRKTEMAECRTDEEKLMKILPFKMKVIILINMSLLLGTYSAIEDTFAGFLTTFCVRQLDWTKAAGSFATSVYWASFGSGRFVGIFLVKFCSPVRIITLYGILLIISFCGMYFSAAGYFDAGIWICSILGGFALSVIFPTVFTWTEAELLPVTGKIASMFLIASSSGTMVNPIVLGFLMDQLTPIWFCYLMLGESITLFILFLSALNLSRKVQEAKENRLETEENIEKPEVFSEDEYGTEEENENLLREFEKIDAMTFLSFADENK